MVMTKNDQGKEKEPASRTLQPLLYGHAFLPYQKLLSPNCRTPVRLHHDTVACERSIYVPNNSEQAHAQKNNNNNYSEQAQLMHIALFYGNAE